MLHPVPPPGWLEEKERRLPDRFVRNGSQHWVTWGGEHRFDALNTGRRQEICRIECPDPRVMILSLFVQNVDPAIATTVAWNIDQGIGRVTSPQLVNLIKGAGTAAVSTNLEVPGRIVIVSALNVTPAVAGAEITVSAVIAPIFPWWGV